MAARRHPACSDLRQRLLDAAMGDSPEGLAILAAMFEAEQDLIREGALPSDSYLYIAKPRPAAADIVREAFERHAGPAPKPHNAAFAVT